MRNNLLYESSPFVVPQVDFSQCNVQVSLTTVGDRGAGGLQQAVQLPAARLGAAALTAMLHVAATERPEAAWFVGDCGPGQASNVNCMAVLLHVVELGS